MIQAPRRAAVTAAIAAAAALAACAGAGGSPLPADISTSGAASAPAVTTSTPGAAPSTPSTPPASDGAPTAAPPAAAAPSAAPFRFLAWGDTKVDTGTSAGDVLQSLSVDARGLDPAPAFTVYLGDLEETGFNDTAGMADQFLAHLNGGSGNGTSAKTFVTRGNHDAVDAASTANWQSYFDLAGVARNVGVTSFTELDPQLTYSYDYGNAHFAIVDAPGDFPTTVAARQLDWLDRDLAAAEARGLTHAFLMWHGPLYTVSTSIHAMDNLNPQPAIQQVLAIAGRHPIVSALLNGHEHLLAYKHIGPSAFPTLSVPHEFEQFTIGTGGAAFHDPAPGRADAVLPYVPAYATIDVNGKSVTVTWYALNKIPQGTFTFTK